MEDHPNVGHLVAPTIMTIQQLQPVVVCIENVPEYAACASAEILRKMLRDMAYSVQEIVVDSRHFGTTEGRTRWFLLAATQGIDVDLQGLCHPQDGTVTHPVGALLDAVPDDSPSWRPFTYLLEKEGRDAAKGNCFAMQIVGPDDTSVPTLRKGYYKGGSTDPLLKHPVTGGLYRLFTPQEHARFKRVPEHLIAGMSAVQAHQGLGQSVAYPVVSAIFERVGKALVGFARSNVTGPTTQSGSANHLPRLQVTG